MIKLAKSDAIALGKALEGEYRALAGYDRAIRDIGDISPLIRIRDVHALHAQLLETWHHSYGVPLTRDGQPVHVEPCGDPRRVCAAAIAEELERIDTCRKLRATVREANISAELHNLERASRDGHLPALREWARRLGRSSTRDAADAKPEIA